MTTSPRLASPKTLAKTNRVRFPNESKQYRQARDNLLAKEIELRRAMEAVVAARRELPLGGRIQEDYVFEGLGPGQDPRHNGTIERLWNIMDLTPEGRPSNWHEQLAYNERSK